MRTWRTPTLYAPRMLLTPSPQAIILAVGLLGIGVITARFLTKGVTIAALGLAGTILAILILSRPQLGVYALVACAGAVRVSVGTGTGSVIVASLACAVLLCLCWMAHRIIHEERLNYLPRAIAIPSASLVFFTVFSLLWGRATLDPRIDMPTTFWRVQLAATALFIVSVGLLFVGADLLRDRQARRWVMTAIVAIGFAAMPFRVLGINMPLLNTFGLFGLWFIVICWSQALANTELSRTKRYLLGCGALAWLVIQFSLQRDWTSGWLPPFLALIAVSILLRPRIGLTMAAGMVGFMLAFQSLVQDLISSEESQGSVGGDFGRFELWERNIDLLREHLIFGTGPAGYALYYVTLVPDKAMSTHNNYMDIVAETGVFGLISFVALLIGLGWLGWRTLPHLTTGADRAACAAVLGGLCAVVQAMMLGDWVIPFVYNQTIAGFDHAVYTWLMLALLCGLWAQQQHPVHDYA